MGTCRYLCALRKTGHTYSAKMLFTLHEKAIYMFSQIFCYLCGAILLSTKAICLKLMRRLVSISVDYMIGERYISYGISHEF